jgi:hypothetical protein
VDFELAVNLYSTAEVRDSMFGGALMIYNSGTVENCTLQTSRYTPGLISVLGAGVIMNNTAGTVAVGDGSVVQGNHIAGSAELGLWGIQSSGTANITKNWLLGNASGIQTAGGNVSGNLIANSAGVGLEINGNVTVTDNTFIGNAGNTIVIVSGTPTIQGNNLETNLGLYDIENQTANNIVADGNWWGTTNTSAIALRIYDYYDGMTTLGKVSYIPTAVGPIQTAPAYVRPVTLDPSSPVGIERVTFEVEFSRPMDVGYLPELSFQSVDNEAWVPVINTTNSGLPSDTVNAITKGLDNSLWFGTDMGAAHFDGINWTVYNTSTSDLPVDAVTAIALDPDGLVWFGTNGGGVARFDGMDWHIYNTTSSGLPADGVNAIATNSDGSVWFGTSAGAAHFDGVNWTVYDTSNSDLPYDVVTAIATDADGSVWLGTYTWAVHFDGINWTTYQVNWNGTEVTDIVTDKNGAHWFSSLGGLAFFDGITWKRYDPELYGLPELGAMYAAAPDPDGSIWLGVGNGAARFDGITWSTYSSYNSTLPELPVKDIASDQENSFWFGTMGGGVGIFRRQPVTPIQDNSGWLDNTHYQASFDFTSLIPRGDYRITVAGAVDTDGMEIIPNTSTIFTVDYAGAITDTSAPPAPHVTACTGLAVGDLSASWTASDPDSAITLYQYAIGTTPGGAEVINWTSTSASSFDLHGLSLNAGQLYYVSVKARNEGGLWSAAATAPGVAAGSDTCAVNLVDVYLPLVKKK